MTFKRVAPNSHYRELRLVSEGGHWELGMSAYSHGMRLRMGHAGQPPRLMDFCMGRDAGLFPQVLVAVLQRLDGLAESASPEAIDAMFPWAETRPDLSKHLAELLEHHAGRDPLLVHPELAGKILCDPTAAADENDWPENSR